MTKYTLYDNTRISDHRKCDRYFYWRHRRHLRSSRPNIPADFGTCWSKAMDVVWPGVKQGMADSTLVDLGFEAFRAHWTSELGYPLVDQMTEDELQQFRFYHEQTAAGMLMEYLPHRRRFIENVEILAIEHPFIVPLQTMNEKVFYTGRIDKVLRWEGRIWGLDHKTTAWYRKSGGFAPEWIDSWNPKSQPDGYMHALNMDFGSAKGILIDGALVHKSERHFTFIPVEKVVGLIEEWLWATVSQITLIEVDDKNLRMHRQFLEDYGNDIMPFMPAFQKRDNSCLQYMKPCPYLDLCKSIPDPEAEPERVPAGFVEEKWEPFDEQKLEELVEEKFSHHTKRW